jgi:RNA 2',3'-cyclic 3'-phosphodiesterase
VNDRVKPLRLFVAASLPREELVRVDAATRDLRDRLIGARWAPVENQHVTLKFLGRTEPGMRTEVERAIQGVTAAHAPASLSVAGLGVFPSPRPARVLWAGLRDEAGLLTSLAGDLATAFEALGYEPEKRAFSPHLTLARFRQPVPIEAGLLDLDEGARFMVTKIELYRSHLSPKGAQYEVMASFELTG